MAAPAAPPPRRRAGANVRDHRTGRTMPGGVRVTASAPPPPSDAGGQAFVFGSFFKARAPEKDRVIQAPAPAIAMLQARAFVREAAPAPASAAPAPVEAPAPQPASPPAEAAPSAPAPAPANSILIFGLICNAVPRCPNPDPAFFDQPRIPAPAGG